MTIQVMSFVTMIKYDDNENGDNIIRVLNKW